MYHSLIIGDKNTYSDFGLIPMSRPVISPPEPKVSYLEIPGRNGVLDLTETLTGSITYENRQGSWKFLVDKNREWSKVALMGIKLFPTKVTFSKSKGQYIADIL